MIHIAEETNRALSGKKNPTISLCFNLEKKGHLRGMPSSPHFRIVCWANSMPVYCNNNNNNNSNNNNFNNRIQRRNLRFFTISSLCRESSPARTLKGSLHNYVQIMCNTSSAYHVQHVVLRATWYEGTAQLSSFIVVHIDCCQRQWDTQVQRGKG